MGSSGPFGQGPAAIDSLDLEGDRAYVGTNSRGLRILDVADPTAPVELGAFEPQEVWLCVRDVEVIGDCAVALSWWPQGSGDKKVVALIDVSNPAAPTNPWWGFVTFGDSNASAEKVATDGRYAYLAVKYANPATAITEYWLGVWDVSNMSSPVVVGSCKLGASVEDMIVRGSQLYTVGQKLQIVDIQDPHAPKLVRTLAEPGYAVAADNELLYTGDWEQALVYGLADPANPAPLGSIVTPRESHELRHIELTDRDPRLTAHYALIDCRPYSGDDLVLVQDVSRPLYLNDESLLKGLGYLEKTLGGHVESMETTGTYAYLGLDSGLSFVHLGPTRYSYCLDDQPTTIPDTVPDGEQHGLAATATVVAAGDGDWYFHVRAVDDNGQWGPAVHRKIRVGNAPAQPTINTLAPDHGLIGDTVVIAGSDFGATGTVRFGATTAVCSAWSETEITCSVPRGVPHGTCDLTVETATGVSNSLPFDVEYPPSDDDIPGVPLPTATARERNARRRRSKRRLPILDGLG